MKIKKIGHCCLLIDIEGKRVLTDPGVFTTEQNIARGIDIILITHEHADHFHLESLKEVLSHNQNAHVVANSSVGEILEAEGIKYTLMQKRDSKEISGLHIEAFDSKHEEIYKDLGQVQNTGYFIGNKLFYPGDSYCDPGKHVEVLALPVSGPWCRLADNLRYALKVKPTKAFPVHDGMLDINKIGVTHKVPEKILSENGIQFIPMITGEEKEF